MRCGDRLHGDKIMGWGGFFDKLLGKLPIQDRKERWKNEIDNLRKEKERLLKGDADAKKALRVIAINKRLLYLEQLLKNASN